MRPLSILQKIHSHFTRYFVVSSLAAAVSTAATVSEGIHLEWDANRESNLSGYKVLYGTATGNYTKALSTGLVPEAEIGGLLPGTTYYFAVQAVNSQLIHSELSEEISYTLPGATNSEITVLSENGSPLTNHLSALSFGYASLVSVVQSKRITIKNNGSAPLNRLGVSLDGTDPTSFSLTSSLPMQVSAAINGGFERGVVGWETTGNVRALPHNNAAEGGAILEFNGANSTPGGTVSQTMATIPGTRYALRFEAAAVAANSQSQTLGVTVEGAATFITDSMTLIGGGNSTARWESHSLTFEATSHSTLVTFSDHSTHTNGIDLWVDDVRLIASHAPNLSGRTPMVTTLQPGESTSFEIAYRPVYPGPKSASLHISSNDADDDPFHIQLIGNSNLAQPEIAVEIQGVDLSSGTATSNLGSIGVGSTSEPRILTIRNRGDSNLANLALGIDGANASEFTTSGLLTPVLAPGASTTVRVFLKPDSGGAKSATLRIASNDLDESPFVIQLGGSASAAAAPEMSVLLANGTKLNSGLFISNFGVTTVGLSSPTTSYTIRNTGSATLSGLKLSVDNSAFTSSTLATTSLAPGASTSFTVAFKPASVGLASATLRIASNDTDRNPFNVGLSGTGAAPTFPEIAIRLPDDTDLVSGKYNSQFGSVNVGATSTARVFIIRNLGTANLTGLSLSGAGDQFSITHPSGTSLAPGGSTTFSVAFRPTSPGAKTATLRIASNDADENPFSISLSGTGLATAPEIAVESNGASLVSGAISTGFGTFNVGTVSPPRTFTIKNLGTAPLSNLALSSTNSQFTFGSLATTSLAPGASTSFSVTFRPGSAGSQSGTLRIASNDADENPFNIGLGGVGAMAPVAKIAVESAGVLLVSGSPSTGFGTFNVGTSSPPRTFTIRNLGTAILTNLALTSTSGDFSFDSLATTSLAPGASTSFSVTFKPDGSGARSATIRIASNDSSANPFNILLSGSGMAASSGPKIAIYLEDGSSFVSGNSSYLEFGNVSLGNTATRTLTVRNLGGANLTGLQMSYGGFGINQYSLDGFSKSSLAPGASTTVKVHFTPSRTSSNFVVVHVLSNDPTQRQFSFIARGAGVPAGAKAAALAAGPGATQTPSTTASPPPSTSVNGLAVVNGTKYRMLTATWMAGNRDYNEVVEVSPNLIDWYSGPHHTTTLISSPNTLQVRDNLPIQSGSDRFIRLQPPAQATPKTDR